LDVEEHGELRRRGLDWSLKRRACLACQHSDYGVAEVNHYKRLGNANIGI
jgi:hypothetical protein